MILIDLPMPEACDVCPFNYDFCWCNAFGESDNWEKYSDDWNNNVCERTTRPEYCPLKEQEVQKFFVDESGKITPLPVVVRCKDCKKRYTVLCIQEEVGNINCQDDWFCADGERK